MHSCPAVPASSLTAFRCISSSADKIAASKRKGMWRGGTVPLGYDLRQRKLRVTPDEAERVRLIYRLYLDLKIYDLLYNGIPRY